MKAPTVVQDHPNASTAIATTPLATLIVWLLGNVFHVAASAEVATVIAGALIAAALVVGKYGILGLWNRILHGNGTG